MFDRFMEHVENLSKESYEIESKTIEAFKSEVEWNSLTSDAGNANSRYPRASILLHEHVAGLDDDEKLHRLVRGIGKLLGVDVSKDRDGKLGVELADRFWRICHWMLRSKKQIRAIDGFLDEERNRNRRFDGAVRKYAAGYHVC